MKQLLRSNADVVAIVLFVLLFAGNPEPNGFRTSLIRNAASSVQHLQVTALNLGNCVENTVRAIENRLRFADRLPCRSFESFSSAVE
ncbi:MAG: hypothetical protein HY821_04745 [Acidobacteria bacterium]|nr:hypothetical protein [Acidobacteriota bacterium]